MYVPADQPVRLTLESNDVLHSLYIPAMRIKKDCVPGRFNTMWFEPDPSVVSEEEPRREFRLHCTEYCGVGHSQMNAYAIVVHPSEWDAVLEEVNKFNPDGLSPVEYGKVVYEQRGGCIACHSVDEAQSRIQGPAWYNLYGSRRQLAVSDTGETEVIADDAYMYESIRYPNRKIAVGYTNAGGMSAYPETVLSPGDVRALIEYMKSISPAHYTGDVLEAFPEGYEGKEDVTVDDLQAGGDEEGVGNASESAEEATE
ncbi:MAG: c-type cytochrome [Planctomycetota bacterium]